VWLSFILALAAQAPGQPVPPERGADLVTVTFAAVTETGQPAADLKAEDVTVRIDGRARVLRSLQLVSLTGGDQDRQTPALPAPFGSNAVTDAGRTVLLAIDEDSFRPGNEQALRQAVDRFVTRLGPRDLVSLVTMPYGGVKVPFTTDHSRLKTALSIIVGRGAVDETGSDLACRTRPTLEALARQIQAVGVREAPAVVTFISAGLAAPRRDAPVTLAPGMCELTLDSFRDVAAAAGAARAQFYIIPPGEIMSVGTIARENIAGTGFRGSDNPVEGLEHLLGVTGGKLLNLGIADSSAFDRIVRESSAYYVAALARERSDRGGRSHQLEVRVARSGVDVRASRAISFPDAEPRGGRPASPSLREMLAVTTVFRDLPLRAAAYSSYEAEGGQIRIVTMAEPVDPAVRFGSLIAALFDRDGKVVANWVAQAADLQRSLVVGSVNAPPGGYRLRVAAIDTTGRSGTADYPLDAELAATGSLKISSILLGLIRGGTFLPKLQFEAEPVVIGYVEMSGAPAGAKVAATLELSDTPNGPARVSVPLTIESGAANRYVGKGALPIGALPPGEYVVRAMVGLEGYPMTRVVRTLRKVLPRAQ
jgi:VWFA-related protein